MLTTVVKHVAIACLSLIPFGVLAQTAADGYNSNPSAEAQQIANTVRANRPVYNASNQTFTMPDGSTLKMSEMSSEYSPSTVGQLEGVNPSNSAQIARATQANNENSNTMSAQAYRTGQAATVATQQYQTTPGQQTVTAGDTEDPVNNDPGIVSLTPADYFITDSRGVVVVQVTLSGGVGPAVVGYETTGGDMPMNFYTPTRGELHWATGQSGMQTFIVPVNVASIMNDHVTGGTINIQLYAARGAKLDSNVSGRIMIGNGQFSVSH